MIPAIIVRPQPGCDITLAAARAAGLDAHGWPLFEVRPVLWDPPPAEAFDGLLIGSANALRHGGPALERYRGLPVHAVGSRTAEAARAAGFTVAAEGEGGLQAVLDRIAPPCRLLRLAGAERVALVPPAGVSVSECVVYASEPVPMPPSLDRLLREPAVILLHSAEAARHLASLCTVAGIDRSRLRLAAIGPRVAEAAGEGWAGAQAAETPGDAALLALAGRMCHEATGPGADRPDATDRGPMQDNSISEAAGNETPGNDAPGEQAKAAPPPRRSGRLVLGIALLAFIAGVGLTGWMGSRGDLDWMKLGEAGSDAAPVPPARVQAAAGPLAGVPTASAVAAAQRPVEVLGTVETRLALLEERMSRIDADAKAASGNAARAEAMLIAFAARRAINRGARLGFLEDQLRLRFGDGQPKAVAAIVAFGTDPVTQDQLSGRLAALTQELESAPGAAPSWRKIQQEIADLFVVRRSAGRANAPGDRLGRAEQLLVLGKVDDAIAEVERLPGAAAAEAWLVDARRYSEVQMALDLIEAAALSGKQEPRAIP